MRTSPSRLVSSKSTRVPFFGSNLIMSGSSHVFYVAVEIRCSETHFRNSHREIGRLKSHYIPMNNLIKYFGVWQKRDFELIVEELRSKSLRN